MDPPDWFTKISPTGQVPLLKVNEKIVFESSVISEFVNDIGTLDLHPSNVIVKANNRSWIAFSSTMFGDLFDIVTGDEEKFNAAKTSLFAKLTKVEATKDNNKFYNGNDFTMIDAAFAPLFMRLAWINEFCKDVLSLKEFKNINTWSEAILSVKAVKTSVVEGLNDVYYSSIESRESHLSTLLIN